MDKTLPIWRTLARASTPRTNTHTPPTRPFTSICTQCLRPKPSTLRTNLKPQRRHKSNPADSPGFTSILDNPTTLIRTNRKHNLWGLALLGAIPLTAFALGCWQVQRLGWKTDLIARFEDRLIREPLPLPPTIDPDAVKDFDYRRVYARGVFRHEKEMLIGPRLHDGEDGYLVITPLDRSAEFPDSKSNTTILVCRGWIPKAKASPSERPLGRQTGEVIVEGLLREPWKKNMFTPENRPAQNAWYFPDVHEMASWTGSQAVWVEETMRPDLIASYQREEKGIPIGRAPEVNLRNNHTQYIFTWFSLSFATAIMMWMVVKKPASGGRRVRHNTRW